MSGPAGPPRSASLARFGVFQLNLRTGELHKRGAKVRFQQQPFQVLQVLLERPGEVVLREELQKRLWPSDTWVDFDHGLNKAVNKLRDALGDSADNPRFVETLAKRGYRFLVPVEFVGEEPSPQSAPAVPDVPAAPPIQRPSRRALYAVAIGVGALAVALAVAVRPRREPTLPPRTMVAVLPFATIDSGPDQEYLSDGMTDEIIMAVGRLSPAHLGVIARTSSMHYKGTRKRLDEIARELGVQYVLEGTVRTGGERLRIGARLVRSADQSPLWAESYERPVADVLEIQTDVARRIAAALALELLPTPPPAGAAPARTKAPAYDVYLKGRYYWNRRGPTDLERAVTLLEEAVLLDDSYVPAWAALADALNVLPWYGLRPPREAYPRSKEAARRALALDDTSAAAHTALAYAHHYYDWNWTDAEREYRRALELNPSYAQAHQWLAAHYAELGRTDEALAEIAHARRLDPRSVIISAATGWIHYLGRRFDEAIAQLHRTLQTDPDFVPARLWLGQALEAAGRPQESIEHYQRVRQLAGSAPTGLGDLARGYAAAGRTREARASLAQLRAVAQTRYIEPDLMARIHEALGEPAEAIAWLERGVEERAVKMVLIAVDPQFDRLRGEPRFRDLLERFDFPRQPPR